MLLQEVGKQLIKEEIYTTEDYYIKAKLYEGYPEGTICFGIKKTQVKVKYIYTF